MSYTADSFILPETRMDDLLINPISKRGWGNEETLDRVLSAGAQIQAVAPQKEVAVRSADASVRTKAEPVQFGCFDLTDPTTVNIFILILLFLNFYLMFCICFGIRKIVKKIKKYGPRTA
nr:hypothetical protein K-LCC10_0072 [Kaumoebavirus]